MDIKVDIEISSGSLQKSIKFEGLSVQKGQRKLHPLKEEVNPLSNSCYKYRFRRAAGEKDAGMEEIEQRLREIKDGNY